MNSMHNEGRSTIPTHQKIPVMQRSTEVMIDNRIERCNDCLKHVSLGIELNVKESKRNEEQCIEKTKFCKRVNL
jgi:hypothetical protein